ncbi:MAG: hypothetical protein OEU92_00980 [Alphaproteobacteria bacterium]|nr:hypothetical protein [Alphaproteobacteria bacterium]
MPDFHVFYYRNRTGDQIASHAPAPMGVDGIAALAGDVLEENGDFLGLVDDDDSVLQFIYVARSDVDQRPIRMEIPDVRKKGNLIRHISNAELFDLLQNLPDRLTADIVTKTDLKPVGS